jgi:hypothetical protein
MRGVGILLEMVTAGSGLLSPAGVSDGAAVSSGLEKRLTATTEALMMAAGEPAEAGRA